MASYTLYLITFALDSVGDVFGSLFLLAAGLLVMRSGALPRWSGWVSILAGVLLLLIFVLVSSVILLRPETAVSDTPVGIR